MSVVFRSVIASLDGDFPNSFWVNCSRRVADRPGLMFQEDQLLPTPICDQTNGSRAKVRERSGSFTIRPCESGKVIFDHSLITAADRKASPTPSLYPEPGDTRSCRK
jgi:hypothetical protein